MDAIWEVRVIDGPLLWTVYALALGLVVTLLVRRWTKATLLAAGVGILAGAAVGIGVYLVANLTLAFGSTVPQTVGIWVTGALAAVGLAVASFWRTKAWRKVIAALTILVVPLAAAVGINAFFGLNPTIGSVFSIVVEKPIAIPTPQPTATPESGPLYLRWQPPAAMPSAGTQGTQVIPSTVSGFNARPAGIYLPPAALVPNAPALPLVIMMMGYPGNPDPSYIGAVLDGFAARHDGLAPIVIVADQIGTGGDPACADSTAFGNARSYITTDVVTWARENLHVVDDPRQWVIAGYSNGGGCALTYGSLYPDTWKNILDISGEPYAGSEDVAGVTSQIYGGDQAAFEASKPVNIMASKSGAYAGTTAVFTAGELDPVYVKAAQEMSDAAAAAGMSVTNDIVPGADHVVSALKGGLEEGFTILYPVLGLSAP